MARELQVGAFNVQCLGEKKMKDPKIVSTIVKIMHKYDIILIQEIRDNTGLIAQKLIDELNKLDPSIQFQYKQSQELGSSTYKERYAYFYRVTTVGSIGTEQYPIENYRFFARPPFSILARAPDSSSFLFIGIHVAPKAAVEEINKLTDVHDKYDGQFKVPIIIGGDFNAAPPYVKPEDWPHISLRNQIRFTWLIGDTVDTTVTKQGKAYDRFVTASQKFNKGEVDPTVIDKKVSDHHPIFCKYGY